MQKFAWALFAGNSASSFLFSLPYVPLVDSTNNILQNKNTYFCVKIDVMAWYHALLTQGNNLRAVHRADIIMSRDETLLGKQQ